MGRFIFRILIIIGVVLVLWVNVPDNGVKILKYTITPPKLDATIAGKKIQREFKTRLGLDLQGGSHFVFEANMTGVKPEDRKEALESTRAIVERRVNLFGLSEPSIQTVKSGDKERITVDLPGVKDPKQAVAMIGQTAQLTFREEGGDTDPKLATLSAVFRLNKETGLTGKDVKKATVIFSDQTAQPNVSLTFTKEGAVKFAEITKRNVGKQVGIFLDFFPISAPTVQTEITDGNAVISGNFTLDDAKSLAVAINSGALPVPIKLVEQKTIGPTLGAIEVQKSVLAGCVGLFLVMLFMMLYYGRLGLVANIGLIIYGLLSLAIFRFIPITLTLPGIAGFILSIGMAVDSNILIFERIKEEERLGMPRAKAISRGFGHAMDAIKDANITTLTVAAILFNPFNWEFLPQFGLVRGFAVTLAIGVLMSLFTGIFVTRSLLKHFYKN